MHQLRSTAICEAVHAHPPPELRQTVERVIPSVPISQLHGFVASLLRDEPETDPGSERGSPERRTAGRPHGGLPSTECDLLTIALRLLSGGS